MAADATGGGDAGSEEGEVRRELSDSSDDPNELTLRRGDLECADVSFVREPSHAANLDLPPGSTVSIDTDEAGLREAMGPILWDPGLAMYCKGAVRGTVLRHSDSGRYTFVRFRHDPPLPGGVILTAHTLPRKCLSIED
eukprot:TRINITY_DN61948_c0_g1_i1.p1 TRINITY_DN61948_c0_g1~~TRINITY_DN61948_c0_g1_i1.p1  ORF type:complete len:139 (+),score=31.83 TRINITY_DN61948_c0_g1_i1:128-544(+)